MYVSSAAASSSATASTAVHVKTLCRGTIKFSASTVQGESIGQLKARLHKKLHVRVEDVRIIARGREIGDEALVNDMVPAAAQTGSDTEADPVVTVFMVLKSTSSAMVSVQVKNSAGTGKRQLELMVSSGMKVDELKKRLHKEFNALPPGEQKLICRGRVMSNAYIIGEYLPLDQRSTLMLMRQPDGEKEVYLKIRLPGCSDAISMSFPAKTTFATIKHVISRSQGIPCETDMFSIYYKRRRMAADASLLSQNVLTKQRSKERIILYLVPGVPVMNPLTKAVVYNFPPGHLEKVFKPKKHRSAGTSTRARAGTAARSHEPAPTRKPKTATGTKSRGKKSQKKGGLFSGLKKGFFDKRPMTPKTKGKGSASGDAPTAPSVNITPRRAAAIKSLDLAQHEEQEMPQPVTDENTSPNVGTALPKRKPEGRRCLSFKKMMTEAMAPPTTTSSPRKDELTKHQKQLKMANPPVVPKKVDSI